MCAAPRVMLASDCLCRPDVLLLCYSVRIYQTFNISNAESAIFYDAPYLAATHADYRLSMRLDLYIVDLPNHRSSQPC